jgi:hypothetical protein
VDTYRQDSDLCGFIAPTIFIESAISITQKPVIAREVHADFASSLDILDTKV